jgi:hypothetical protein
MTQKNLPSTVPVFIIAKEHANQDSLPLRYGFYYEDDKWIDIKRTSAPSRNKQEDNIEFTGEITDHDGIAHEGFFVVRQFQNGYKLVTTFDKKVRTEHELSKVLQYLRISGRITCDWLVKKSPMYVKGKLNTHAAIVEALAEDISAKDKASLTEAYEEVLTSLKDDNAKKDTQIGKLGEEIDEMDVQIDEMETILDIQSIENKTLTKQNISYQSEIQDLRSALDQVSKKQSEQPAGSKSYTPPSDLNAKLVTSVWQSLTGSDYRNCGVEAYVSRVEQRNNNIILYTYNTKGEEIILSDFGYKGFVSQIYSYLEKRVGQRAVYIITWKNNQPPKLAADTMMLPRYQNLWLAS